MKRYVVDASVVIQWYLPEQYSEHSERLLSPSIELLCPDLLISEIGNTLWKHVRRAECSYDEALAILDEIESPFLRVWSAALLAGEALDIACRMNRTFYDSVYIALAVKTDCPMVTADLKLYNAMKVTPLGNHIAWVGDIP